MSISISEGQESPFYRYNCCLRKGEIDNYAQVVRGQDKGWLTSRILLGVTKASRIGEVSGVFVSRCCATLWDSECCEDGLETGPSRPEVQFWSRVCFPEFGCNDIEHHDGTLQLLRILYSFASMAVYHT